MIGLFLCTAASLPADAPPVSVEGDSPIELVGWRDRIRRPFGKPRGHAPQPRTAPRPSSPRSMPAQQAVTQPRFAKPLVDEREATAAMEQMLRNAVSEEVSWGDCGLDFTELLLRSTSTAFPLPLNERAAFIDEVVVAWREDGGPLRSISQLIIGGGEIVPLSAGVRDGERVVRVRQIGGNGDLQYVDFLIRRTGQGYKFVDAYKVGDAEWMSETIGRLFAAKAAADPRMIESLPPEVMTRCREMKRLERVAAAVRHDQGQVGVELLDELPEAIRTQSNARALRLCLTAQAGDEEAYAAQADAFRKDFPEEAASEILTIRLLQHSDDLEALTAAHTALDEKGYADAFRLAQLGVELTKVGRAEEAEERFEAAIAAEPQRVAYQLAAANAFAQIGDAARAKAWIKRADRDFLVEWRKLGGLVHADRFVGTPEHRELLKYFGDRAPAMPNAVPEPQLALPPEGAFRL